MAFIPIFVAVDAIGNIPIFISLVENISRKERKKAIVQSVLTATLVALTFMFVGKLIFKFIGITISDFQIAGGILLFVIATRLLLPGTSKFVIMSPDNKDIGVFPLGTPLITGPAVLTTTLMMLNSFGLTLTLVSLLLNMLIVWFVLIEADSILNTVGVSGIRAFSKIMHILLASIAVMMVRQGIESVFIK